MGKMFRKLSLCTTLIMGLLMPALASASVDAVNQWPATPHIVSNTNAGTVTGTYKVGIGPSRVLLVAVATEYGAAQTPLISASFGGQALTQIVTNTTQNNKIWLGYLNEAGILLAGANKTLSVTTSITANLTAMYATAATFGGVDQAAPIVASQTNATAGATTIALTAFNVSGFTGNAGLVAYASNWNGQTSNVATAGYSELRDYAGTNFNVANGYSIITAAGTTAPTSTAAASAIGAFAAVSLNPYLRLATITTCGDCHGNPPQDGSARNVPPGQFPGTHDKHAGSDPSEYGFACTTCHYDNTGNLKHDSAFKNLTGSKLPKNAYSLGNKIAVTNATGNGTCSNVYCHSTGRTTGQGLTRQSLGWTTAPGAIPCLACHAGRDAAQGNLAKSSAGFSLSTTHSQHFKAPYTAAQMNCNICHSKTVTDAATLKQYSGVVKHVDGVATVTFNDINYGSYTSFKANKTCANVACHGGKTRSAWSNAGALNTTNTCTHCHGQPQAANILSSNTERKNFAPGWVNGANTGTSTDQITVATDMRVGAHFVHLSSIYMTKIKCNECHRVPSQSFDGTHMTGPRYSSQSITFAQASTAVKNTTATAFVSGTSAGPATCTTTYCHGSKLIQNDTAGTARSPQWNQDLTNNTPSVATCGRCHGLPPNSVSGSHTGLTAVTQCAGCHAAVVNASGAIINKLLHINGVNNFLVTCNGCHDYDTRSGGTVWGAGGPYAVEGYGAHAKHIEYLKSRGGVITTLNPNGDTFGGAAYNATCGVCHIQTEALNHNTGGGGTRTINFNSSLARLFGTGSPTYNGNVGTSSSVNPKSCSNTDCHYRTSPVWSTF